MLAKFGVNWYIWYRATNDYTYTHPQCMPIMAFALHEILCRRRRKSQHSAAGFLRHTVWRKLGWVRIGSLGFGQINAIYFRLPLFISAYFNFVMFSST
jgi:hypothetical protein